MNIDHILHTGFQILDFRLFGEEDLHWEGSTWNFERGTIIEVTAESSFVQSGTSDDESIVLLSSLGQFFQQSHENVRRHFSFMNLVQYQYLILAQILVRQQFPK